MEDDRWQMADLQDAFPCHPFHPWTGGVINRKFTFLRIKAKKEAG
jgi:hypothetical protein